MQHIRSLEQKIDSSQLMHCNGPGQGVAHTYMVRSGQGHQTWYHSIC